jgi:putative sterol carrier protein
MEYCRPVKERGLLLCVTISLLIMQLGMSSLSAAEPENSVPQDVFNGMRESFRPEKAIGVHARYQFELSGPAGGRWWIEVNNGTSKMGRGKISNPSVTFITSDKDWVALANGHLAGIWATLTGRLKIRGDQQLARKLDEMFP